MACRTALLTATFLAALCSTASAQRYPRVYSPTGRPYGPTMSGYQYHRQYGRPWHGYGGQNLGAGINLGFYSDRLNAGYGWQRFGRFRGYYGPPFVGNFYTPPVYVGPYEPLPSPMMPGTFDEERLAEPPVEPPPAKAPRTYVPSSPEAIARSVHKQDLGDTWMKKLDYANAISNYRAAVLIAPDRAEPKFRLGFVLMATGRFHDAIAQFELGLELDPDWPTNSFTFDDIIGDNLIEKSVVMNRVAEWVKQDVRDPNRLFLMGVTLHLDRRQEAGLFFDTAYKLTGGANHLLAFLNAGPPQDRAATPQNSGPASPPAQPSGSPVPPLPAPELGTGQSQPPGKNLTPAPQKPAPTVIPQKSPAKPETKSPPSDEADDAPPKPDSVLEKQKKETPPPNATPSNSETAKPAPAAAPKPAPPASQKQEPAESETNSSESGPQLVPQG